jgi:subtilase family serine protease
MLLVITKYKYSTKFNFIQVNNELVVYEKRKTMLF